jgi:hypothetical protein
MKREEEPVIGRTVLGLVATFVFAGLVGGSTAYAKACPALCRTQIKACKQAGTEKPKAACKRACKKHFVDGCKATSTVPKERTCPASRRARSRLNDHGAARAPVARPDFTAPRFTARLRPPPIDASDAIGVCDQPGLRRAVAASTAGACRLTAERRPGRSSSRTQLVQELELGRHLLDPPQRQQRRRVAAVGASPSRRPRATRRSRTVPRALVSAHSVAQLVEQAGAVAGGQHVGEDDPASKDGCSGFGSRSHASKSRQPLAVMRYGMRRGRHPADSHERDQAVRLSLLCRDRSCPGSPCPDCRRYSRGSGRSRAAVDRREAARVCSTAFSAAVLRRRFRLLLERAGRSQSSCRERVRLAC